MVGEVVREIFSKDKCLSQNMKAAMRREAHPMQREKEAVVRGAEQNQVAGE